MRRLVGLALGLVLIVAAPSRGDDPPKSPLDELRALQKSVTDAQRKAMQLMQKARTAADDDEKKKLNEEFQKALADYQKLQREAQEKAVEIVKADPKSDTALQAAIFALPGLRTKPELLSEVLDLVVKNHLQSEKLASLVPVLASSINTAGRDNKEKALQMLETIVEKSPHKKVQATALYAVADYYKNASEPRGRPAPENADELAAKSEKAFERLEKEFGEVTQIRTPTLTRTYGESAKSALFELRHLRVGKVVPEIEGEDADGVKFKLSDYRGKVVMLDFWGHW